MQPGDHKKPCALACWSPAEIMGTTQPGKQGPGNWQVAGVPGQGPSKGKDVREPGAGGLNAVPGGCNDPGGELPWVR